MQNHSNDVNAQNKITNEEWRSVVGYEGYYEVSNMGRVKSLARTVPMSDGRKYRVKEKICKTSWNGKYYHAVLSRGGKEETLLTHRLMMEAFHGLDPDKPHCRHMDGNARNNVLSNLEWGTVQENAEDRMRHGTTVKNRVMGKRPLKGMGDELIRLRYEEKWTFKRIAEQFDVTDNSVYLAIRKARKAKQIKE